MMKIEIEEEDLVYVLRCADGDADFEEYEKGFPDEAKEIRDRIRHVTFTLNNQIGFEKYAYDNDYGLTEIEKK